MGTNLKPQLILKIEQLEPHPGNPRKDLGDITELTQSIRENGVLQNLTVVPLDQEGSTDGIWEVIDRIEEKDRNKWVINNPERAIVIMAYKKLETGKGPWNNVGEAEGWSIKGATDLMSLMDDIGYEPSAMEMSLADGTSVLYLKPVEEETENA